MSKIYTIELVGSVPVSIKELDGTVYDTLTTSHRKVTVSATVYALVKTAVEGLEAAGYLSISEYNPVEPLKPPVYVVAASNITLSAEQTIDSVAVKDGDRVLVQNQSSPEENGIYNCVSGAAWERSLDFDSDAEVKAGMLIIVASGTTYADTIWTVAAEDPIVLGETSLTITRLAAPA